METMMSYSFWTAPRENTLFLRAVNRASWWVLILVFFIQYTLFPTWINTMAMLYVVMAWCFISGIFFRPGVLRAFPLSSFLVIGFGCTQFYFPLLFTTLEGKPLTYNLDLPQVVFLHSMSALMILIVIHGIYRSISHTWFSKPAKGSLLLRRLGLFEVPSELQVWLMGLMGLAAMFYTSFIAKANGNTDVGTASKIMEAFLPFTYAPFFIPFGKLYGSYRPSSKAIGSKLALFTVLLFLVSIGKNSRGAFMIGFTSLGFAFCLGMLLGQIKTRLFTLKYVVIGMGAIWLLTGPFSDLGTAMVIVRHQRDNIPKSEFIRLTYEAFQDKKAIRELEALSKLGSSKQQDWDERYLDNIFLARFCNIKFNDLCLRLAREMHPDNRAVRDFSIGRVWAILPDPILKMFKPHWDKNEVNGMSYGDCLRYQISGNEYVLGSYMTGHLSGTGMAAFGWWYLLLLAIFIGPAYFVFDLLHVRYFTWKSPEGEPCIGRRFSLCALLSLTAIFQFLPSESVITCIQFLIRGWWQMVLFYALLFHVTRAMLKLGSRF